jgi:mitochondrial fission protein ELM1
MTNLEKLTLQELKRDGITTETLKNLSDSDRTVLIIEYAKSASKRFQLFHEKLNVSKLAREAFNMKVYSII